MAGIHFVVFNPSSDDFDRNRLAMDGVLPGGNLQIQPPTARRGSTRSSARPTARTSSCRRGGTAASRSPSSERRPGRESAVALRALIVAILVLALAELGCHCRRAKPDGADRLRRRRDARPRRRSACGSATRTPSSPASGIQLALGRSRRREPRVAADEPAASSRRTGRTPSRRGPPTARILAAAGFDALAIANNHAGDAGPATVPDTMRALDAAGPRGDRRGATTAAAAYRARLRPRARADESRSSPSTTRAKGRGPAWRRRASPGGTPAGPARPSCAPAPRRTWSSSGSTAAPTTTRPPTRGCSISAGCSPAGAQTSCGARGRMSSSRPRSSAARAAARPSSPRASATSSSTSTIPGTRTGELLEVLAGQGGVRAFRLGATAQAAVERRRLRALAAAARERGRARRRVVEPRAARQPGARARRAVARTASRGRSSTAATGRPRGQRDTSARRLVLAPVPAHRCQCLIPRARLVDRRGLTAHVGLYVPGSRRELWVAGTLLSPVAQLAPCDGALAVAYTTLNGKSTVSTGAWAWRGFGFSPLPVLAGPGPAGLRRCRRRRAARSRHTRTHTMRGPLKGTMLLLAAVALVTASCGGSSSTSSTSTPPAASGTAFSIPAPIVAVRALPPCAGNEPERLLCRPVDAHLARKGRPCPLREGRAEAGPGARADAPEAGLRASSGRARACSSPSTRGTSTAASPSTSRPTPRTTASTSCSTRRCATSSRRPCCRSSNRS